MAKSDSWAEVACLGCGRVLRIGSYALIDQGAGMIVVERERIVCDCGNIVEVPLLFLSADEAEEFLRHHLFPPSSLLEIFVESQTPSDDRTIN